MPVQLGEYCIRCGALCTITPNSDNTQQLYLCPNGHGIQRITNIPAEGEQAQPEGADAATVQEIEQMQEP